MLEELPRHAGYVIAAYALAALAVAGLVAWVVHGRRSQIRMLSMLEGRRDSAAPGRRGGNE